MTNTAYNSKHIQLNEKIIIKRNRKKNCRKRGNNVEFFTNFFSYHLRLNNIGPAVFRSNVQWHRNSFHSLQRTPEFSRFVEIVNFEFIFFLLVSSIRRLQNFILIFVLLFRVWRASMPHQVKKRTFFFGPKRWCIVLRLCSFVCLCSVGP